MPNLRNVLIKEALDNWQGHMFTEHKDRLMHILLGEELPLTDCARCLLLHSQLMDLAPQE